jgi:hypothetical protein
MSSEVAAKGHGIDPADIPPLGPDDVLVGVTREEMENLLRDWHQKVLDYEYFEFYAAQSMWREKCYANERARRLEDILGETAAAVVRGVERDEEARMGCERWRVFRRGTTEEADQLCAEIHEDIGRCSQKLRNPGQAEAFLRTHPDRVFIDEDGDLWCWAADRSAGPADGRPDLVLAIRTPHGGGTRSRDVRMPMTDGWFPPYGLES